MNNLNITQNSNDLNESEKTQEKLYSNEASLDDILTYSEDISQNISSNKPHSNSKPIIKRENINPNVELLNKKEIPVINSFNSEVAMSFLNTPYTPYDNNHNNNQKEYYSKSESKSKSRSQSNDYERDKQNFKSCSDFKSNSSNKNDTFECNMPNNLKDISEIHLSMSNLLSQFDIKDISISKSINDNIKKNNSEKKKHNLNIVVNNDNYPNMKSENLFYKKNKKNTNQISSTLNFNQNQISEDHSNTNSMCNYQNISNINEISGNNNNKNNIKKEENKQNINDNKNISNNEINEFSIKLNISMDNCSDNKYKNDKNKYLDGIIDEVEINRKDNYTTSSKKENSFYFSNQNNKVIKNSIKYTKAQCINSLIQNNIIINDNKNYNSNKQYNLSDNPIKTKDTSSDRNNEKLNIQKIVILSPQKLSFEIQKNDCIQISTSNKNKNNAINNINKNISSYNDNHSSLSISKAYDFSSDNNYFYNNKYLKKNITTSFMIYPNQSNKNVLNYQKKSSNSKQTYINYKNINIQKEESNKFFYNPKNIVVIASPSLNSINNNTLKKNENDLHTPDLNKNKIAPMTCVHKGSLIYCNDNYHTINNNNTIKNDSINNFSNASKKNNYSFTKNIIKKTNCNRAKKIFNQEKKLVYLKNNINKNNQNNQNKINVNYINSNTKAKQKFIKNKNNSFTKTNTNNFISTNNKKITNKKKEISKNDEKEYIKNKEQIHASDNNINNNKNKDLKIKRNLNIRNSLNNINSINSINKRKNNVKKAKINNKNKTIIDKINYDLIKESSLFSMIYNISQKNTSKNNSRKCSNDKPLDEKDSTMVLKKQKIDKLKKNENSMSQKNIKCKYEKKIVRHKTNNSINTILGKALEDSGKKMKIKKKNNVELKTKISCNQLNDKLNLNKIKDNNKRTEKNKNNFIISNDKKKDMHKKINTQINLNELTSNFNIINQKRRKNNKSLYNFGNIYFINQNQILKNDFEPINPYINNNENNNSNHLVNCIYKNKIKIYGDNIDNKSKQQNPMYQMSNINENNNNIKENINICNKNNPLSISNAKQTPTIIMDFSKYKKKGDYRSHFGSMVDRKHPILSGYNSDNKVEYYETQLISEN